MSTLYDKIQQAEQFAPQRQDGPVAIDQSGAAKFAMDWAARQAPKAEEPAVQMKPIIPVAN